MKWELFQGFIWHADHKKIFYTQTFNLLQIKCIRYYDLYTFLFQKAKESNILSIKRVSLYTWNILDIQNLNFDF